jgi:hypothetical protein
MSEGCAIIISAVITVAGMSFIQFLNHLRRKADFQEHLLFEDFQKRIAIYEDVIGTLSGMITNEELPLNISSGGIKAKIADYAHTLDALIVKLSLFGSPGSVKILQSIRFQIFDVQDNGVDVGDVVYAPHVRAVLVTMIKNALSEFTETARREASIKILDEFVSHPAKGIKMFAKHDQSKHGTRKDNRRDKSKR